MVGRKVGGDQTEKKLDRSTSDEKFRFYCEEGDRRFFTSAADGAARIHGVAPDDDVCFTELRVAKLVG